jgi:hypothetical protein
MPNQRRYKPILTRSQLNCITGHNRYKPLGLCSLRNTVHPTVELSNRFRITFREENIRYFTVQGKTSRKQDLGAVNPASVMVREMFCLPTPPWHTKEESSLMVGQPRQCRSICGWVNCEADTRGCLSDAAIIQSS